MTDVQQLDLLGHFGYILLFVGMTLLSRGQSLGWVLRLIGEIIWTYISYEMQLYSGVLWGLAFMAIDLSGIHRARSRTQ